MGFSQSTITSVNPPVYNGFQVYLSWKSTSPAGTWFQIYLNEQLAWWGQTTQATLILGTTGPVHVDIGTVAAGEEQTEFSADLATAPARRAELSWLGGTFEAADIAGFRVYGSDTAGGYGVNGFGDGPFGEVDISTPLAAITAYPSAIQTDGFGFGGFGYGAFGQAAGTYSWISNPLTSGNWSYAVVPHDSVGNAGTVGLVGVTINCPPLEPAAFSDGSRLHYTYSRLTQEITLDWNASPG